MKPLLVLALLAGCAAPPPLAEPPPPPVTTPAPVVPSVAPEALSPPLASLAKQYHQQAKKEVQAVIRPSVTADYVAAVQTADEDARAALRVLEAQKHHPTAQALAAARAAVRALATVLDEAP